MFENQNTENNEFSYNRFAYMVLHFLTTLLLLELDEMEASKYINKRCRECFYNQRNSKFISFLRQARKYEKCLHHPNVFLNDSMVKQREKGTCIQRFVSRLVKTTLR